MTDSHFSCLCEVIPPLLFWKIHKHCYNSDKYLHSPLLLITFGYYEGGIIVGKTTELSHCCGWIWLLQMWMSWMREFVFIVPTFDSLLLFRRFSPVPWGVNWKCTVFNLKRKKTLIIQVAVFTQVLEILERFWISLQRKEKKTRLWRFWKVRTGLWKCLNDL